MLLGSSQCIFSKSGKKLNCINFLENFDSMSGIRNFLHDNAGIYAWQHVNSKKIYIGSSKCLWRRFLSYKNAFFHKKEKTMKKVNSKLMNAVNKHNFANFKFYVLEINNSGVKSLRTLEQKYLDEFCPFGDNGYNIHRTTNVCHEDFKDLDEKAIQKIKEAHTGENSSNAKLNNNKVKEIKKRLCKGDTLKNIAKDYSVSTTVISNIKRNKTWSHILLSEEEEKILKQKTKEQKKFKFSEELVKNIKIDLNNGMRITDIAKKYNVNYTSVSGLKYGNYYKHINP